VRLNSKAQPLKLELHTNRKMFKRQYRLSEPDKVEMGKQIKQMEEAGVIDRSSSSYYNSPTYLVLFISDIAVFMLKRDVKLQPTNHTSFLRNRVKNTW